MHHRERASELAEGGRHAAGLGALLGAVHAGLQPCGVHYESYVAFGVE